MPLAVAAIGQTHAILAVLDLSVGAMISFGVVVASYLIGADATIGQILVGVAAVLGQECSWACQRRTGPRHQDLDRGDTRHAVDPRRHS